MPGLELALILALRTTGLNEWKVGYPQVRGGYFDPNECIMRGVNNWKEIMRQTRGKAVPELRRMLGLQYRGKNKKERNKEFRAGYVILRMSVSQSVSQFSLVSAAADAYNSACHASNSTEDPAANIELPGSFFFFPLVPLILFFVFLSLSSGNAQKE